MWKSRRNSSSPLLPEGLRIYAVGDVHGRADLLEQLFSRVDEDVKEHPISETLHIFVGDYIDRGQNSAAVLDLVIERAQTHRMVCLKG
ncbi:MAG: metallophosphoesterase, partial [Methylocella sp.]